MDELFGAGNTIDTRQKSIQDLEKYAIFETWKDDIERIELKNRPSLPER